MLEYTLTLLAKLASCAQVAIAVWQTTFKQRGADVMKKQPETEKAPEQMLTLGQVAKRLGCLRWQVQRLFEREMLPDRYRVGLLRVVPESELDDVRRAAREAGYVK